MTSVVRDVRERRALLDRLRTSEASFRTVFEHAPVGLEIVRICPDGRREIVLANQTLSHLLGEPVEALVGGDLSRFIDSRDVDQAAATVTAAARGRVPTDSGVWGFRSRDGSRRWLDVRAVPVELPDLPGPLALVQLVDVTERRAAEVRRAHAAAVDQLITQVVIAVLTGQTLPATYRQVADGVAKVFAAHDVAIVLPGTDTESFALAGAHGPLATALMRGESPVPHEFITWLTGLSTHGLIVPTAAPGLPAERTTLLGPMAATRFGALSSGTDGVMIMAREDGKEPFTSDEVDLLTSLARQLTLAIRLGRAHSEQRRQAARRDAYLRRLEDALRPLSDPAGIQAVACRTLGEHLQASRVLYADIEADVEAANVDDIADEQVVVRHEYVQGPDPLTGPLSVPSALVAHVRHRDPVVIDDIATDARFTAGERERILHTAAAANIIMPLVKSDRWIAVLAVHSAHPRHWTDLEVQLTQDTAERTWAAVERSQAEQASAAERVLRRAAERELVEQAARERRERLEQEFITNAAHELRTPLTGILAAVDALEAGAGEDASQRQRFLTHLRRESTRLARLSDSLLLLAQAQSLGPPPAEPFTVADLLDTIAAGLQVADAVTASVDADPALTLHANPGLTEVLVGNLAANAARHTVAGHIRLAAYTEDAAVVLEVNDTGPGMDEATLSRVRDRFYRHTTRRDGEGFGLGLSIAAQAAAAMGATLDLRSTPGVGTRARVVFPAAGRERPPGTPARQDMPPGNITR